MCNSKILDEPKYGISLFSHIQFSSLNDPRNSGNDWYNFGCLENIPSSVKYNFLQTDIDFIQPPGTSNMVDMRIDLWEGIALMHYEDRFFLNPVRWDRVKRDLCDGWCYKPWISYDEECGKPFLMDGRHRIVSLLKFTNLTTGTFVIEKKYINYIYQYFKLE